MEGAAGRQAGQVRRPAFNGDELLFDILIEPRDRLKKPDGIGMPGGAVEVPCHSLLNDLTGIHDHDPVCIPCHNTKVVGDDDQGCAPVPGKILHELQELCLDGHIKGGGGLVCDDEPGVAGKTHGDHDPLPHAATELMGVCTRPGLGVGICTFLSSSMHIFSADFFPMALWSIRGSMT